MYARIGQAPEYTESIPEATRYFRESVGPALNDHAGFMNSRFLVDIPGNCCLMVTLWKSEATREQAETSEFQQKVLQDMKSYFRGKPTVDYYEKPFRSSDQVARLNPAPVFFSKRRSLITIAQAPSASYNALTPTRE